MSKHRIESDREAPPPDQLGLFLTEIATGIGEQVAALEASPSGETPASSALRDYSSQLLAAAEATGADGRVDWWSIPDVAPDGGTSLEPPMGCTGAVKHDHMDRPSIHHDAGTCPVHEEEEEALQFVEVVEVFEREDGIYVFGDLRAAERFEDAVAKGRDLSEDESATYRRETPINVGDAAERIIAAERADVLVEGAGCATVAEEVGEGIPLAEILPKLQAGDREAARRAEGLIRHWIALDAA